MSDATPATTPSTGASNDNVMAAVASIPLVGLIIYFAMKDSSDLVKFYAKQSIGLLILSIAFTIVSFVLVFIPYIGALLSCVVSIASLATFVLWLVLVINALQGNKFRTPLMSDMLDQMIK